MKFYNLIQDTYVAMHSCTGLFCLDLCRVTLCSLACQSSISDCGYLGILWLQVVHAVEGKVPVFLDGGVRRGTDVFKALALGAQAVLVSSPPQTI